MSKVLIAALSVGLFTLMAPAARAGHEIENGGDICEQRFLVVRDDIRSWIEQGGANQLVLPKGLSITQYKTKMLAEIAQAQISCVDSDIQVDGVEKTCENLSDDGKSPRIICNRQRFMETDESDQYVLVHHEYAGLSGFEVNQGLRSQYEISNQITGALQEQATMKLVVNRRLDAGLETDLPAIEAIKLIAPERSYSGVVPKTGQPCQVSFDSFGGLDVTIKTPGASASSSKSVWFELRSYPDQISTSLNGDLDHLELKVVAQYTMAGGSNGNSVQQTYTLLLSGKDGSPSSIQILVSSKGPGALNEETSAACEFHSKA
ncbi:MAG: hypothetical protein P4M08_12175 [Oligoflexia bacterium]|nr:hypothetical protein [Oligoflexia bacterium]